MRLRRVKFPWWGFVILLWLLALAVSLEPAEDTTDQVSMEAVE